jgi:hypothetical protein
MPGGRTRSDYGFSVPLGKVNTLEEALGMAQSFLDTKEHEIKVLKTHDITNTLSLRFGLGAKAYARILSFPPEFLQRLGSSEIELEVVGCLECEPERS